MKSWIITGGVACGKSQVSRTLPQRSDSLVAFFSADAEVGLLLEDMEVIQQLALTFGSELRGLSSEDRRAWLRRNVLSDQERRKQLEKILHPLVLSRLEERRVEAQHAGMNLFLAEVPLHYEIGATVSADLVIVVASSRSVQVRRMMENRKLNERDVQRFLDAQWPIEAKVERADVVIWNDGSLASLDAQVLTLASLLLRE